MLGFPFLTGLPGFANTKVFVAEVAARIRKLMMDELVEMHREFVRYYGPDTDASPKWMEGDGLNELMSMLQKTVIEHRENDSTSLVPLYSPGNIEECMHKVQPVKYGEEVCFNGIFMLKASSSGLELGNSTWAIKGPRAALPTYQVQYVSAHASDFDYSSLKENDVILFLDYSSLNDLDEDNEKLNGDSMDETDSSLCRYSVLRAAWKEPCIVLCPHWSLRLGPAVHLLRRWHADKQCLLVVEQGNDAELSLKPFMPLAIQVLECSFLSGVRVGKIDPLLGMLKPKFVMLPEGLKSRCSIKEVPWSFFYYSKGKTIELPNLREDFEVHLATDVAFRLQPRQLNETTAVARLRTKLLVSSGRYLLASAENQADQSKRHLLHWSTIDPDRLLSALQEKGMVSSFASDDSSTASECSVLITSPVDALVNITSDRIVIYCDNERTSNQIYDALSSVCKGI